MFVVKFSYIALNIILYSKSLFNIEINTTLTEKTLIKTLFIYTLLYWVPANL